MTAVASYITRSIKTMRSKLRCFGAARASLNGGGRPQSITHPMLEDLHEHLLEKPEQYLPSTRMISLEACKVSVLNPCTAIIIIGYRCAHSPLLDRG
jgi:hypothetical protein